MRFDAKIEFSGYAWWYLDAVSDDGAHAITLIAFIGSVFSPYYAWAREKNPEHFCAMNVALYGRQTRWAMTERGQKFLRRGENFLRIGPSRLHWDGTRLVADIEEVGAPVPRRLRGRITLEPRAVQGRVFVLDAAGRHRWRPVAPAARVRVDFTEPELSWSGQGYLDTNEGDAPLLKDFSSWNWCRAEGAAGPKIFYDVVERDGHAHGLALGFGADGTARDIPAPPVRALKPGFWGVAREVRADAGTVPLVQKALEDGPFYTRSLVTSTVAGERLTFMHESLSLRRFSQFWVRALLPFRMPRRF